MPKAIATSTMADASALASTRRQVFGGAVLAVLTGGVFGAAIVLPNPGEAFPAAASPDAEMVRVCHTFAEAEFRNWWRYVTAPDGLADAQVWEEDWPTLAWITATPATTPAGWAAKALALSAWDREMYDDLDPAESDTRTALLAALLRDIAAPARAAILARCAADYGPLPKGYTADARWIANSPPAVVAAPPQAHRDAELLTACAEFDALETAYRATDFEAAPGTREAAAADAEQGRIAAAQLPLVNRMVDHRAATRAGQVARARSLAAWKPELLGDGPAEDIGECLMSAIVRDLVEGA